MNLTIRRGTREDATACGIIDFEAFKSISSQHNFPWDFPSAEVAVAVVGSILSNSGFYAAVAELDGKIVGSNFLDERNPISGVGPISVDPALQNQTIGRQLMGAVMERSVQRGFAGCRLVQATYHNRSLCLYTKLGFETREPLSKMFGTPPRLKLDGYEVRAAAAGDVADCNQLCRRIHGHDRGGELLDAIARGSARVVEHLGRITGYATEIAFFAHAVGETNQDIEALIGDASEIGGGGFLVPTRGLFRWCLETGLRLGSSDDPNDNRAVQRTGRRVPPFRSLLIKCGSRNSLKREKRLLDRTYLWLARKVTKLRSLQQSLIENALNHSHTTNATNDTC